MGLEELVKLKDGMRVIELDECFDGSIKDKYDLIAMLFHTKSMNIEDDLTLEGQRGDTRRYFGGGEQCYHCGEIGHGARKCPNKRENICLYCAGKHLGEPCLYLLCENCRRVGHHERSCREKSIVKSEICRHCPTEPHLLLDCPLGWRKYNFIHRKIPKELFMSCAYCHADDHFIDDCSMKDAKVSIFSKNYTKYLNKWKSASVKRRKSD